MIIKNIVSVLPENSYNSKTIANLCGSNPNIFIEKTGILSRHFIEQGHNEIELALKAGELLLSQPAVDKSKVGLCVYVGQVRTCPIPHTSAILHGKLGLEKSCACFDIGLACSGYPYALSIAASFMEANKITDAVLITCDPYSKILDMSDRTTAPLFGDAATATWISHSGSGLNIGRGDFGTDGQHFSYLYCSPTHTNNFLHMDGKGIFNFVLKTIPHSIERCLEINRQSMSDIDYFIFHQANLFMIEHLRKSLGLPPQKCPSFLENVANTVSSSIPMVLENIWLDLNPPKKIVLSGFGGGLSWGTLYMEAC